MNKSSSAVKCLMVCCAMSLWAPLAKADFLQWALNDVTYTETGAFTKGSLSGSFEYDAVTHLYQNINITNSPISGFPALPYNTFLSVPFAPGGTATSDLHLFVTAGPAAINAYTMELTFFSALTSSGGTINIVPNSPNSQMQRCANADCSQGAGGIVNFANINGGTVTAVPLPAAGWLLLSGLGGLAAMRRRKLAA